jgi:methylglutaconyl-CoA hydratase
MSTSPLEIVRDGSVLRITLNRPDKRNALTRAMLAELLPALQSLSEDTRLIVLAANGPVFCAGMDLQEMQATAQQPNSAEIWQQDSDIYRQIVETLFTTPCPTLCVVQGPVLAGGVGLVLACDLVIATPDASFALPEPKRGITASMVTPLLVHRIGSGPAGWLLLSGQTMSAEAASKCGLVHETIDAHSLPAEVTTRISTILTGAPEALRVTKRQLLHDAAPAMRTALDQASKLSATSRAHPEAREGLQAFLEKRSPNWASPKTGS